MTISLAGITGMLFSELSSVPLIGLSITLYMLLIGMLPGGGWTAQYMTTELWVLPLVAASVLAWKRQRYTWSALAAFAAFSVRELAALLIVGGLVAVWQRRGVLWPWVSAVVLSVAGYVAHAVAVQPHLVTEGRETRLLGTGSLMTVGRMAGFGLPGGAATGFILLAIAAVYVWRSEDRLVLAPIAVLPLAGLVADRPYWGIIAVPFLVLWAAESAAAVIRPRLSNSRREVSTGETSTRPTT